MSDSDSDGQKTFTLQSEWNKTRLAQGKDEPTSRGWMGVRGAVLEKSHVIEESGNLASQEKLWAVSCASEQIIDISMTRSLFLAAASFDARFPNQVRGSGKTYSKDVPANSLSPTESNKALVGHTAMRSHAKPEESLVILTTRSPRRFITTAGKSKRELDSCDFEHHSLTVLSSLAT